MTTAELAERARPVLLRPAGAADEPFVRELFAAERAAALGVEALGVEALAEPLREALVDVQVRGWLVGLPAHREETVAELDGHRVGHLMTHRAGGRLRVVWVCVARSARGRGVGSALLGARLDQAAAEGLDVDLRVDPANQPALALYARLGFETTGRDGADMLLTRPVPQERR